ncbi:cytochrome-c peroxidase [Photobacterium sanguinicancri]|uniref:cytochrome-c peroxidase n=1 Tax=Photobacterium sanguinicancri TaxID=875932 RepID=UPI0026E48600|nr:cytochrome c peroxidase [Photobacterium sanguinicancri]MDO6498845.1 cytochrome c peroxidase [Photobacterium sanguinicancri]
MQHLSLRWAIPCLTVTLFSVYLYVTFREPILNDFPKNKSRTENAFLSQSVSAIEKQVITEKSKAKLGFELFLEPRLSSNNQVSCESCHHIYSNGAESIPASVGVNGKGKRNSPTVFNISLNSRFFWDGRAASLEQQIDGPIHNPLEMDSTWPSIVQFLNQSEYYQKRFNQEYSGEISEKTVKNALVAFMNTLTTPDAPFDRFLGGEADAISNVAQNGWQKFQQLGCVYCHQGQNIGGNLFQKFGNLTALETQFGSSVNQDLGRFEVTGEENDRHVFRVPSLRNVAITAPYFHDGKTATLEEAIIVMARVQLGQELSPMTVVEISAFLNTLTAPKPSALEELVQ